MRRTSAILAVARLDLAELVRSRWLVACLVVYGALAGLFVLVGLRESTVFGFTGAGRALVALTHALLALLPLMALTGTSQVIGRAREDGTLEVLLSHPISRGAYFWGVATTRLLALTLPLVLAMAAVAAHARLAFGEAVPWGHLGRSLAVSVSLVAAYCGLGLWLSAAVRSATRTALYSLLLTILNPQDEVIIPMDGEPGRSMSERLRARRESVTERVFMAASMTPSDRPFVWWCNLNAESEMLASMIPDAVEVRGSDKDDEKERKLKAFSDGQIRVLITKPKIAGFGMNWQHCADTGFVGLNDSFEQVYQAVRRFWRFGQTKPVNVTFIAASTEGAVLENLRRKEADAEHMGASMVAHMADISSEIIQGSVRNTDAYNPTVLMTLPEWLKEENEE